MRLDSLLTIFGLIFTTAISAEAQIDTTNLVIPKNSDDIVGTQVMSDKSDAKIGVSPVKAEDNEPKAAYLKEPSTPGAAVAGEGEDEENKSSYNSFIISISMIIVSEIGDKTFLIAALMAMRNPRWVVFSAGFSSLVVMTVLSGVVGHALPALISRRLTLFSASILFVVFGYKLLNDGLSMSKDLGVEEELAEVEEEIASSKMNEQMNDMEVGANNSQKKKPWHKEVLSQLKDLASFVLSPVWIQVFVMTFLGEWGDRSQIATIAMAAGSEYWFVILGAIVGHGICTAAACVGGKLLAKKISMRNVTLGGALAFFVFAILYLYDALYNPDV